jgi:hypothetical protein
MASKLLVLSGAVLALLLASAVPDPADAHRAGGHGYSHHGGGHSYGRSYSQSHPNPGYRPHGHQGHGHFRHRHRHFFIGAPFVYDYAYGAYDGGCYWLRRRALYTGSSYWWSRYYACIGAY